MQKSSLFKSFTTIAGVVAVYAIYIYAYFLSGPGMKGNILKGDFTGKVNSWGYEALAAYALLAFTGVIVYSVFKKIGGKRNEK